MPWGAARLSGGRGAQGRVYLADSDLMKPRARERVHCFDEITGKTLWTHVYDVAYEDWAFDPSQEIGPVATPIVRDGKVYTQGRVGHLFCLDARTGDVPWRRNLDKDYQVKFAPGAPSPLIDGDLLILFIGGKPGACLVALHKNERHVPMAGVARLNPDFTDTLAIDREVQPLKAPRVRHKRPFRGRFGMVPR